jgi:hypothetical protein
MAKVIVRGEWVEVEVIRSEPEVGLAFFTFACDQGVWCSIPLPAEGMIRAWMPAIAVASLHADTEH